MQKVENIDETPLLQSTCYVQCGDNLELLKSQPNESVNMIYCDILYGTGRNFGDYQDLNPIRSEIESHYLPRLIEMKRVLKQNGSIYLQMDTRINHWMRILMDDIFGYDNFRNEIVWNYQNIMTSTTNYFRKEHDIILLYSKTSNYIFNKQKIKTTPYKKSKRKHIDGKNMRLKNENGKIDYEMCDEKYLGDVFILPNIASTSKESVKYPTQKPKELISRFVLASTNEGDVVADYYLGSGTTAKVCQELNRNFIGCDLNPKAIEITNGRLDGGR